MCFSSHRSGAIQRRRCRTRSTGLVRTQEAGEARLGPPRGCPGAPPRCVLALPLPGHRVVVTESSPSGERRHPLRRDPFCRDKAPVSDIRAAWVPRGCPIGARSWAPGGAPRLARGVLTPAGRRRTGPPGPGRRAAHSATPPRQSAGASRPPRYSPSRRRSDPPGASPAASPAARATRGCGPLPTPPGRGPTGGAGGHTSRSAPSRSTAPSLPR